MRHFTNSFRRLIPDTIYMYMYIEMIERINTKNELHNGNSLKRIKEERMEIRAGTEVLVPLSVKD